MLRPKPRCLPSYPRKGTGLVAFVGEAPSDAEMMDGRPLVGPSGRIFDQLLRSANLDRRDYLVTNVFDTQAPDNDVAKWTKSRTDAVAAGWPLEHDFDGRYFDPAFLEYNLARLGSELDRARPVCVVPMGNTALWAFTGLLSITAARGSCFLATRLRPGLKILPALHPAHVMRQWTYFHPTVADFMKAQREAEAGPKLEYTEREIWLRPTMTDMIAFEKRYLSKAELITLDIETTAVGRQITCLSLGADSTHALVVPFMDWSKPSRSYWPTVDAELAAWDYVERVLGSPTPKLMQNGPYDAYWLWARYGIAVRNYCEDTRLVHHVLYPEMRKDLGFMGASYANEGPWKLMRHGQGDKRDD